MRYFGIDKDEIHKFVRWKSFLKGFFDLYEDRTSIIVTGSARLDIYKRGGDSLMGRYFLYHMHPLGVAETTVKTWTATLEYFHEGFRVRPWFRNVENSIRKTPKWYQRDWCEVADEGARFENLVACHLLKAVDMWNDLGLGDYALHYVRNKAKEEVDFLVAKDGRPWFLVEAKLSDVRLSPALASMQKATGAAHAFQVVRDLPYADADAFSHRDPISVSARSFLSQLF